MSDFFDNSHVLDVGLQGSVGPSVSPWEMLQQSFVQQRRVDSELALSSELSSRWTENLSRLRALGQNFDTAILPRSYSRFAEYVREGTEVTEDDDYPIRREFENLQRANEAIRQLNNPEIQTFEQILDEVSAMQREVEEETASMSERTDAWGQIAGMAGAIAGSFTMRDPLNLLTMGLGFGRTVATRIAVDMGIAAGVVGATEYTAVQPNRRLAGLPERDPLFNIAAATLGAGIIRGGIEGIGAGVRRLRGQPEEIDFDLRDSQLQQMFEANQASPTARAGAQALDDITFVERNNPYGDGQAANARFMAELQQVQRLMGGEPMTAVARVLPPMPFEYIRKAADFEIVREQAPLLYARMEQAQARVEELTQQVNRLTEREGPDLIETVRLVDNEAADQLQQLSVKVNDETVPEPARVAADIEAQAIVQRVGVERIMRAADTVDSKRWYEVRSLRASRRAANKEYRRTYRAVEAEVERIRAEQTRAEAAQQRQAVGIFADATQGRSFNWSALQHDYVEARVNGINEAVDTLDDRALAIVQRQMARAAEDGPFTTEQAAEIADQALRDAGKIDIGLREPVDPDFRIATDDGDMSVADAMRDLQDDADLDDAMRNCLL